MKSNFKMTEGKGTNCWRGLTGGGRGSRLFCWHLWTFTDCKMRNWFGNSWIPGYSGSELKKSFIFYLLSECAWRTKITNDRYPLSLLTFSWDFTKKAILTDIFLTFSLLQIILLTFTDFTDFTDALDTLPHPLKFQIFSQPSLFSSTPSQGLIKISP